MMSTWTGSLTVVLLVLSIDKGVADRGVEGLGGLESELQVLLDQLASTFNTSYTLSLVSRELNVSLAAGIDDHATGRRVAPESIFPLGSCTKPFTAVAVLRAVERGQIGLDDSVASLADDYLVRHLGRSLTQLYGPDADRMTVRQLLKMRAGLEDQDADKEFKKAVEFPRAAYGPYQMINDSNKTLICKPDTCGSYSDLSYGVLGLVLLKAQGLADYEDLDQLGSAVGKERAALFPHTLFINDGKCSDYRAQGMVSQYMPNADGTAFENIVDNACANAWTCGNIASDTAGIALFHWLLHTRQLLSAESYSEMMNLSQNFDKYWELGMPYGMAMFPILVQQPLPPASKMWQGPFDLIGHNGEDYGSVSEISGWSIPLKMGISMASNSYEGMNCTLRDLDNGYAHHYAACVVYKALLIKLNGTAGFECDRSLTGPSTLAC